MNPGGEAARARSGPGWPTEVALALAVATFAWFFSGLHQTENIVHPPASVERLAAFDAEIPYQYRILVPLLIHGAQRFGLAHSLSMDAMELARALDALCVIGLFYALRALIARFVDGRWKPSAWSALGLATLPFLYVLPRAWPAYYPYDLSAILCFALGLCWMHARHWPAYYWLFPFATLNRETTSVLVVLFLLTQWKAMPIHRLMLHLAVQTAIWFGIKWLLQRTFGNNGGVGEYYGDALRDNLALLSQPAKLFAMTMVFGYLWLPLLFVAHRIREPFARRALLGLPLFFALGFRFAQFDELRIYGEGVPLVILGLATGFTGRRAASDPPRAAITAPSTR